MQKTMYLSLLVSLFLQSGIVYSQVPTLNPTQTVNLATGEMGFALPLGKVRGINGHDYPINLNYKAGIRLHQVASPAGLGFELSPGSIVRKKVFADDLNIGGEQNYLNETVSNEEPDGFLGTIQNIYRKATFVISLFEPNVGMFLRIGESAFVNGIGLASYDPSKYNSGGDHNPVYSYEGGKGKGILKGGIPTDIPDVFFVNTPYVSGKIILGNNSKFIPDDPNVTGVNAMFDIKTNIFKIFLSDGTRLVFDAFDITKDSTIISGNKKIGNFNCSYSQSECYLNGSITKWHLTKILYPDFVGNENDLDNSNGNWIEFEYETLFADNSPIESPIENATELVVPRVSIATGPFQASDRDVIQSKTVYKNMGHLTFSWVPTIYSIFENEATRLFSPFPASHS